ncbi:triose-phosphate isomerase [Treponema sp.]
MKYIFLNLKRFDIPVHQGGVNSLSPIAAWGPYIVESIHKALSSREALSGNYSLPIFFPEAHLIPAVTALAGSQEGAIKSIPLEIGCQGVHFADTASGGNFGAFSTLRTANAAKDLGCTWTMIGHSEERRYKNELMSLAGASIEKSREAIDVLLNKEIGCALAAGLKVVFCIGETAEEVSNREAELKTQIERGLAGMDLTNIVIAYEPVWAIGPGKTPPSADQIADIARMIKKLTSCPLVYGGGLKKENAEGIGAIQDLDGGLIALTRFSGQIGFHPEEYVEIIDAYVRGGRV